jgi:hypothetical protein
MSINIINFIYMLMCYKNSYTLSSTFDFEVSSATFTLTDGALEYIYIDTLTYNNNNNNNNFSWLYINIDI